MRKTLLLAALLTGWTITSAQQFQQVYLGDLGVNNPEMDWGDYDNDGDPDLLVAMQDDTTAQIKIDIYRNDGNDVFFRWNVYNDPASFFLFTAGFVDLDNDSVLDIAMSYEQTSTQKTVIVFTGNGSGGFAAPVTILMNGGRMEFADMDVDGDMDFVLGVYPPRIYRNNGNLNFTPVGSPLAGETQVDFAWGDLNGDNLPDLVSTGETSIGVYHLRVYQNNGAGNFAQVTDLGDYRGDVHLGDIDNDGDNDLMFSGVTDYSTANTHVYINNGPFVLDSVAQNFTDVNGDGEFLDANNDGVLDYVASGHQNPPTGVHHTILYTGTGNGTFTEMNLNPIVPPVLGDIATCDYNNDGYDDFAICGQTPSSNAQCRAYIFKNTLKSDIREENMAAIHCFPSVTHNEFNLFPETFRGPLNISVFTASGSLALTQFQNVTDSTPVPVSLGTLPAGIYIVRLESGFSAQCVRVIKQ